MSLSLRLFPHVLPTLRYYGRYPVSALTSLNPVAQTFTSISTSGVGLPSVFGHAAAAYGAKLLIFGECRNLDSAVSCFFRLTCSALLGTHMTWPLFIIALDFAFAGGKDYYGNLYSTLYVVDTANAYTVTTPSYAGSSPSARYLSSAIMVQPKSGCYEWLLYGQSTARRLWSASLLLYRHRRIKRQVQLPERAILQRQCALLACCLCD